MRSNLEKAIVHLLNEENDKADALFHKFIVDRARQIHESLRQGEDLVLEEGWDEEITTESFFTEDDLEGLEGDDAAGDEAGDEFAGDDAEGDADMGGAEGDMMDAEADVEDAEGDMADAADDMGDDLAGDEGEGDVEDRIEDLEDQLERLTAEFEALMADEGGDDMDADMGGDDMAGDDMDAGMDGDEMGDDLGGEADDMADGMEDDMSDEAGDEESFDDLSESIVSELEKISVTLSDGKEIGDGKAVPQNKKSLLGNGGKADMDDAEATASKQVTHTGFEREPSPAVKDMKKRRNTRNKGTEGQSSVSKEGDKGALINKDFAGSHNDKSLLGNSK